MRLTWDKACGTIQLSLAIVKFKACDLDEGDRGNSEKQGPWIADILAPLCQLCGLGRVTQPHRASVSLSLKMGIL